MAAVYFAFVKTRKGEWGFKEVVKNPDYWDKTAKMMKDAKSAAAEAQRWEDDQVADFAKRYILDATSSRNEWASTRTLRDLGERTHPAVMELLGDCSLYDRLVTPTGVDILPEAPFNRACDLLGDSPGVQAVKVLEPFLKDPSDRIRKDAALAIAKTGAESITPLIRQAFSDEDSYVRSYALMGLGFSLKRDGLAGIVKKELYPDVEELLRTDRNAGDAAKILHRLDPAKAAEFFSSEEVFKGDAPILNHVLKVMADEKIPVPENRLRTLIASIETREMKYPANYALSEALRMLGQLKHEDDREFLRKRLSHPDERVAEGAAAGVLCSFGVEDYREKIWEVEESSGYDSLNENQRMHQAVVMCDAEIINGGFAQYFVNSSGDRWKDAVKGYKAMGFRVGLEVLEKALAKFGPDGPSVDRNSRQKQLSKLYQRDDSTFDDLDSRYYKSGEVLDVYLTRFVLENPESFR